MKAILKGNRVRVLTAAVAIAALSACLALLTAIVLKPTSADAASTTYTVEDLGSLTSLGDSAPYDINESGHVVGVSDGRPFLYKNGQMTDLGTLPTTQPYGEAAGINDNDKITGTANIDDPQRGTVQHGFFYDASQPGSQMQDLGYYPGNYPASSGADINNSGQIAGITNGVHAAIYQNGEWHDLGTLGGPQSYAFDINDSGTVVGRADAPVTYLNDHYTAPHAFMYADGRMQDIDGSSSLRSQASGINDNGAITGFRRDNSTGDFHAFLWTSGGGMQDLGAPQGYLNSFGEDINNNGQIVGIAGDTAGLYEDGQWKLLNRLVPTDSGWHAGSGTGWQLLEAAAINDDGQIVVRATKNGVKARALLLTPGSSTPPDSSKPTLNLPSDMTREATGSAGAEVTYEATATDENPANPDVNCSPSSGSTFVLGTTRVNCSATDAAGNEATGGFDVTVRDTTAPTISGVPADITKTTTSASGTQVSYNSPMANDAVDGSVSVNCSPASGSTFALGETTVSCSASDAHSNAATKTFKVNVLYDFGNGTGGGFAEPVTSGALNQVKASAGVPVKFGLGANLGLDIFAAGYPTSRKITCDTQQVIDPIEETVAVSSSGLKYDAATGQYVYSWKTDKAWSNTCRQLMIKLKDGSEHPINFKFK